MIDISNVQLYGSMAFNYQTPNGATISGIISQRYIYSVGNDKNYDSSIFATVTMSNIILGDVVNYNAYFNDKTVGYKIITISNLNYQLYNNVTCQYFSKIINCHIYRSNKNI